MKTFTWAALDAAGTHVNRNKFALVSLEIAEPPAVVAACAKGDRDARPCLP